MLVDQGGETPLDSKRHSGPATIRQVLKALVGFEERPKGHPDGPLPHVWGGRLVITGDA